MNPPVFISYARASSGPAAADLRRELGELAFLDTSEIETGQRFPAALANALLGAKVVVLFADELYFQRWYCLWELRTSLVPFLEQPTNASEQEKTSALAHLLIALPPTGAPSELERLPPALRASNWPASTDTTRLAELVRARLREVDVSMSERLARIGRLETIRTSLLEETALPSPASLAGVPLFLREPSPSLQEAFVGRADELWRIDFKLSTGRGSPTDAAPPLALEGGGGVGKTQLAREYFYRFGPRHYPGGLFWIDADVSEERLEEQQYGILRLLQPGLPELVEFRKAGHEVRRELAEALHRIPATRPVLYVVDNIPEPMPGQRPRPLHSWCPGLGKVALLMTSRVRGAPGQGISSIQVLPLAPEPAMTMLTHQLHRNRLPEQDWARIAEWVGNLPLALRLLNSALQMGGLTPVELLARSQQDGPTRELDRQHATLSEWVPEGVLRGVTEALSISYERLPREAQQAARLIAQLSHEPIPLRVAQSLGPELSTPSVRIALRARSFITPVEGDDSLWLGSMHRVLADFLRLRAGNPMEELLQVASNLQRILDPADYHDPDAWSFLSAWLPHADAVFQRLRGSRLGSEAEISIEVNLGLHIGYALAEMGLTAQAARLGEQLLARARDTLGPEHLDTLAVMSNLALTRKELGDFRSAQELGEFVLEASRRILGEDNQKTLSSAGNLAAVLHVQGNFDRSLELKKKVLEGCRRTLGPKHFQTLAAMNNLALLLMDMGETERAVTLLEETLDIAIDELGGRHSFVLTGMYNLALMHRDLENLPEALEMLEGVASMFLEVLGPDHPRTRYVMADLERMLPQEEESDEELAEEQDELDADEARLLSLVEAARFEEARPIAERLLAGMEQEQGPEHPNTLTAMNNLAWVCRNQGDLHRARSLEEKALEIRSRKNGNEHREVAQAALSLLTTLRRLGDRAAFEEVLTRHLGWLLSRPSQSLNEEQRQIRALVLQMRQS